jgi:hypothetical protein
LDECLSRRVTDFTNKIRAPSPSSPVFPFPELIRSPAAMGPNTSLAEQHQTENCQFSSSPMRACIPDRRYAQMIYPSDANRIAEVCYAA